MAALLARLGLLCAFTGHLLACLIEHLLRFQCRFGGLHETIPLAGAQLTVHVLIQRIGQHRQQIVRGLLRHFRSYEFLNLLRDAIGLCVLIHHCSSRHLYAQVVGLQPVDSHAGSTEHAAGQSTAEEADTDLLCLIRKGQRESLVIIVAKLFVGVDRLLPFALIAGDRDVCEQIEELRAYFLAALGQGVLADLYKGAFAARGDSVQ